MRAWCRAPEGLLWCRRSQKRICLSSTPRAAPRVRCVRPASTRAARSWRPVTRLLLGRGKNTSIFLTRDTPLLRLWSNREYIALRRASSAGRRSTRSRTLLTKVAPSVSPTSNVRQRSPERFLGTANGIFWAGKSQTSIFASIALL